MGAVSDDLFEHLFVVQLGVFASELHFQVFDFCFGDNCDLGNCVHI